MRHLVAIVALAPLALLACGSASAPSESEAITEQAVTRCQVGYYYKCSGSSCSCVPGTAPPPPPPPPGCNFTLQPAPAPPEYAWVESWAVLTDSGQCNDVPGKGGHWANLASQYVDQSTKLSCFDGVPDEYLNAGRVTDCHSVFGNYDCCTYVWWPDSFTVPACGATPQTGLQSQDTQALCTRNGMTFVAIEQQGCDPQPDSLSTGSSSGGGPGCPAPGGGSCGTCSRQ
jgi:hypothetical protein